MVVSDQEPRGQLRWFLQQIIAKPETIECHSTIPVNSMLRKWKFYGQKMKILPVPRHSFFFFFFPRFGGPFRAAASNSNFRVKSCVKSRDCGIQEGLHGTL